MSALRSLRSVVDCFERDGGCVHGASGEWYWTLWRPKSVGAAIVKRITGFRRTAISELYLAFRETVSSFRAPIPRLFTVVDIQELPEVLLVSWSGPDPERDKEDRYFGDVSGFPLSKVARIQIPPFPGVTPVIRAFDIASFRTRRDWGATIRWVLWVLFRLQKTPLFRWNFIFRLSPEGKTAFFVSEDILELLSRATHLPKIIALPYEQQPWQVELIRRVRASFPKIEFVGYIHSSLQFFPVQYIHHANVPDRLVVHGEAYRKILVNHLGWPASSVVTSSSFRFKKMRKFSASTIFLPYEFRCAELILGEMRSLKRKLGKELSCPVVLSHPVTGRLPAHKKLKEDIVALFDDHKEAASEEATTIVTVGLTTTIFEALAAGVTVISIFESPELDGVVPELWPDLEVERVTENAFRLKARNPEAFLLYPAGPACTMPEWCLRYAENIATTGFPSDG